MKITKILLENCSNLVEKWSLIGQFWILLKFYAKLQRIGLNPKTVLIIILWFPGPILDFAQNLCKIAKKYVSKDKNFNHNLVIFRAQNLNWPILDFAQILCKIAKNWFESKDSFNHNLVISRANFGFCSKIYAKLKKICFKRQKF